MTKRQTRGLRIWPLSRRSFRPETERPHPFQRVHAGPVGIAAYSLALAGRRDEARAYLAAIHKALPHYGIEEFLAAMQFDPEGEKLFRQAAERIG